MQTLKNMTNLDVSRLFTSDIGLKKSLTHWHGKAASDTLFAKLQNWEKRFPLWDTLAAESARPEKLPRVEKYDRLGNRVERIVLPLETRIIRREVVEAGIFDNVSETEKFAKIYLLCQIGEAGVTCPLACTDGLIRVLAAKGQAEVKARYLKPLASSATPLVHSSAIFDKAGPMGV